MGAQNLISTQAPAAPQIKPASPPSKSIGEPAAVAILRAADALHALPDMLIVGGLSVDAWLDRAGVSENVVATAGPAPLFRGRRALGGGDAVLEGALVKRV